MIADHAGRGRPRTLACNKGFDANPHTYAEKRAGKRTGEEGP